MGQANKTTSVVEVTSDAYVCLVCKLAEFVIVTLAAFG